MRFHLVDRIDGHVPGKTIAARKLTSADEEFWIGTGAAAVMPPALVLESLCQAGAWLVYLSTGGARSAALLSVAAVEFLEPVRPGDTLDLAGAVDSMDEERAVLSGAVSVDGRVVLRATDIMCALIDTEQLDDPARFRRRADLALRSQSAG